MTDFVRIDPHGNVTPEDTSARNRLAERAGRFYLAPTSADLLLGVRAPIQGASSAAPKVVLAGDLSGISLADLVAFLHQNRMTGVLRVLTPSGERAVVLKTGEVQGAASDDPADRIGETAVRLGLITRDQLEKALAAKPETSRVGRTLVESGALKSHDLWRCMQHQVSEIFYAMLLAREGAFLLVQEEIEDRKTVSMSTQGLLMDAIRRLDEMTEFRKRLPSSRAFIVPTRPPGPGLQPLERAIYDLCDGARTVEDIAKAARLTEFETTKLIHHLLEDGLVEVATAPTPQAPPPRPSPRTPRTIVLGFNRIFQEIFAAVARTDRAGEFSSAAAGALLGHAAKAQVLRGLLFSDEGVLPEATLLANLAKLEGTEPDTMRLLHTALEELMYFLLFESGEILDGPTNDALVGRAKDLLGAMEEA